MALFDDLFVTLGCPNCDYGMDVELLSIRLEESIFCPCCKITIQMIDADASVHGAQEEIESAIKDFESNLKKLNKTINFKI